MPRSKLAACVTTAALTVGAAAGAAGNAVAAVPVYAAPRPRPDDTPARN